LFFFFEQAREQVRRCLKRNGRSLLTSAASEPVRLT